MAARTGPSSVVGVGLPYMACQFPPWRGRDMVVVGAGRMHAPARHCQSRADAQRRVDGGEGRINIFDHYCGIAEGAERKLWSAWG
jgi:hypothetical protein